MQSVESEIDQNIFWKHWRMTVDSTIVDSTVISHIKRQLNDAVLDNEQAYAIAHSAKGKAAGL